MAIYHRNISDEAVRNRISVMCVIVFIVFFGFRGFVFEDWMGYYPEYEKCTLDNIALFPSKEFPFEGGFTLLMVICKSIVHSFHFLVLICCLIDTFLLVRFFRERISNLPLGFMLYLCMGGLIMSTNLMRNSISILIFINALKYIEQRRPLPFFTLCFIALTFHMSSLFYFPMYFILHRNINKWVYLGVFIIGNLILLLHIPILMALLSKVGNLTDIMNAKVDSYTNFSGDISFKISIGYLERLMTGALIFCYYDRLKELREENIVFINSILLYFIMFFVFSEFDEISKRLSNLFLYAYWILWYDIIKCFAISNNRRLFIGILSIYCILKVMGTAQLPDAQYDNILFGAKSYEERLYIINRSSNEN
jgi:hypothetical protein